VLSGALAKDRSLKFILLSVNSIQTAKIRWAVTRETLAE
jgi:hypothetical protein